MLHPGEAKPAPLDPVLTHHNFILWPEGPVVAIILLLFLLLIACRLLARLVRDAA